MTPGFGSDSARCRHAPLAWAPVLVLLFLLAGCDAARVDRPVFEPAFPGLTFEAPVALRAEPGGSGRLYVVEQAGVVRSFLPSSPAQSLIEVLDIQERVLGPDVDIEAGLLSIALHPAFVQSGGMYVFYTTAVAGEWASRLSRFTVDPATGIADPTSEQVLLELPRFDLKHNGGDLHFGPDGYLYVSIGDGGCCGDPLKNGQDRTSLFSTIIRIDVDGTTGDLPYTIPPDNPFVGNGEGWREEIWAYGLRNPWRFSFHPETGEIWVGDVGSLSYEEINRVVPGGNYGWSVMEGPDCFEWPPGSGTTCEPTGIEPAWYYDREVGISVTGGYFYRGTRAPALSGRYVFADWGMPSIFVGTLDAGAETLVHVDEIYRDEYPFISAFGEGADGELYFLGYFSGRVYRFGRGAGVQ